ncbi:MAG: TetR/AcrR family transcriptional regulator [Solirubrobacteraceae bacterium]
MEAGHAAGHRPDDAARPRRGRRPRTYAAVLDATARLLETTPLAELSVAQILDGAGVGRTSFYEHFTSKDDVVARLVQTIGDDAARDMEPMFRRDGRSPDEAIRAGIANLVRSGARHAPLLVAVAEEWPATPRLRTLWFQTLGLVTARLAEMIDRDRAAGIAPAGADSQALAATLVWSAERTLHVAFGGDHPTLIDEGSVVDPLAQLFIGTIYGRAPQPR